MNRVTSRRRGQRREDALMMEAARHLCQDRPRSGQDQAKIKPRSEHGWHPWVDATKQWKGTAPASARTRGRREAAGGCTEAMQLSTPMAMGKEAREARRTVADPEGISHPFLCKLCTAWNHRTSAGAGAGRALGGTRHSWEGQCRGRRTGGSTQRPTVRKTSEPGTREVRRNDPLPPSCPFPQLCRRRDVVDRRDRHLVSASSIAWADRRFPWNDASFCVADCTSPCMGT